MASRLIKDISLIDDSITKGELERFTLSVLRDYCKKHSLVSTGTKDVVIKRVLEYVYKDYVTSKENGDPNLSGIYLNSFPFISFYFYFI